MNTGMAMKFIPTVMLTLIPMSISMSTLTTMSTARMSMYTITAIPESTVPMSMSIRPMTRKNMTILMKNKRLVIRGPGYTGKRSPDPAMPQL